MHGREGINFYTKEHKPSKVYVYYVKESKISLCLQHLDLNRQNVLFNENNFKISIIAWSESDINFSPYHDLFFFTYSYSFQVRKEGGIKSFIDLLWNK